ncbi:MAG: PD40 domain-containing protein [Bacteroidales bacterium]|nr:PD40 domain-containing protein [Bacteroidales bacterium]
MNFAINENGSRYRVLVSGKSGQEINISSSNGIIRFSKRQWKRILSDNTGDTLFFRVTLSDKSYGHQEFRPFYMYVSADQVDPYIAYRLIHPGYYSWSAMKIEQRSITDFRKKTILENQLLDMNCINCHSFNNYNPDRFMVHVRGSNGGTYIIYNGKIERRDPKIETMPGSATYPSWHPEGKFIAFSSNQVRQAFYAHQSRSIEVFDLISTLIVYNTESNEIINISEPDTTRYLYSFPSWSPEGKYLYFCRARQTGSNGGVSMEDIMNTHYDLLRIPFDAETGFYGETEMIFNASEKGKSVSFPRVSPDGKYLVLTVHDYGTFPIWHKEADLYLIDLENFQGKLMDLNSNDSESYHTWSSNGKWLIFSSKRLDGRSTRPFLAHFDSWNRSGKPFVLPQRNPLRYRTMLRSFNIPEFVSGQVKVSPKDFVKASRSKPVSAKPGNLTDSIPGWDPARLNVKRNPGEKPIHE